jgi:hypothetical protein
MRSSFGLAVQSRGIALDRIVCCFGEYLAVQHQYASCAFEHVDKVNCSFVNSEILFPPANYKCYRLDEQLVVI